MPPRRTPIWVRLIIVITIGFVLNLAMTALCVCGASGGLHKGEETLPASYARWPAWIPADWPVPARAQRWSGTSAGYTVEEIESTQAGELYAVTSMSYGWPLRSMVRWDAGLKLGAAADRAA